MRSRRDPARCGKATGRNRTVEYKTHLRGPCFTTNGNSRLQQSTDVMTVAYILDTKICPVQPMRIRVDDKGSTRVKSGTVNAQVRLHSDSDSFFRLYMGGLLRRSDGLSGICIGRIVCR
jgi:inosine-uridine nucleoside N-ribohydrolase